MLNRLDSIIGCGGVVLGPAQMRDFIYSVAWAVKLSEDAGGTASDQVSEMLSDIICAAEDALPLVSWDGKFEPEFKPWTHNESSRILRAIVKIVGVPSLNMLKFIFGRYTAGDNTAGDFRFLFSDGESLDDEYIGEDFSETLKCADETPETRELVQYVHQMSAHFRGPSGTTRL